MNETTATDLDAVSVEFEQAALEITNPDAPYNPAALTVVQAANFFRDEITRLRAENARLTARNAAAWDLAYRWESEPPFDTKQLIQDLRDAL